tara:strand:- start:4896 stop:5837 length:942 start_codon:yes stop_codon:yes gene_type:complete
MRFNKPKFWDIEKPNFYSNLLRPISSLVGLISKLKKLGVTRKKYLNIKTICIGNIYLGGTGKTSLCLKVYDLFSKNYKCCFIKKYYEDQKDEQKILENKGRLFCYSSRSDAIDAAIKENFEIAIFDDGLQDYSIKFDKTLLCFNSINWVGNSLTIPAGPLREDLNNIKNYKNIFINGNLENIKNIEKKVYEISRDINIFSGEYIPMDIGNFDQKRNYLAFSGIGNHETFVSMLKKFGFNIQKDIKYPDHYKYSKFDQDFILSTAKKNNYKIITTEKDYYRLDTQYIDKFQFIKSELKINDENKLVNTILDLNE